MKRLFFVFILASFCLGFKSPKEIYIAGCGNDFIARVSYTTGEILWQLSAPAPEDCNDIEYTKKGILYTYKHGARLVDLNGEILWNYSAPQMCEVYTATVVKSGYMLAMCGEPARIVFLDNKGVKINEIVFDVSVKNNVHAQFRQIITTPQGNFLIPVMGSGEVIELNRDGVVVKRINIGGSLFSIHPTSVSDEYMVSCGDASKIVVFRLSDGKIIREINNNNLRGTEKLLFVAELKMLKNGNILIANWNGHVSDKNQPKIFEINPHNEVVSKLPFNDKIKNISSFYLK